MLGHINNKSTNEFLNENIIKGDVITINWNTLLKSIKSHPEWLSTFGEEGQDDNNFIFGLCDKVALFICNYSDFIEHGGQIISIHDFMPNEDEEIETALFHVCLYIDNKFYDGSCTDGTPLISNLPLIKRYKDDFLDIAQYYNMTLEQLIRTMSMPINMDELRKGKAVYNSDKSLLSNTINEGTKSRTMIPRECTTRRQ